MPPYVTFIIVLCSAAAAFAVMCMAMVLMIYKKMFGYHFEHDPLVTTYTPEGVGVTSSPVEIELDEKMIRGGV